MATEYEWDSRKAAANLAKHGVEFNFAKAVFFDRAALTEIDDSDPSEERWKTVGLADGKVLVVVHTEPDIDVIRIVSARKATKREERIYFGQTAP